MYNKQIDYLIVGTGPTGVAAAAALIGRGVIPTFIDSGSYSSRHERKRPLAAPTRGGGGVVGRPDITPKGVARKTWFGDESIYVPHPDSNVFYDERIEKNGTIR
jgi:hypothetical protein